MKIAELGAYSMKGRSAWTHGMNDNGCEHAYYGVQFIQTRNLLRRIIFMYNPLLTFW